MKFLKKDIYIGIGHRQLEEWKITFFCEYGCELVLEFCWHLVLEYLKFNVLPISLRDSPFSTTSGYIWKVIFNLKMDTQTEWKKDFVLFRS